MRAIAFAIAAFACAASVGAAPALLPAGITVRETMGGKAPARYRIEVPASLAARVHLRHEGINVAFRLFEDGQQIGSSEDSNGDSGYEMLAAPIRDADAAYEVAVEPLVSQDCGSYELVMEQLPADENAHLVAEAHRLSFDAHRLENVGDAKSMEASLQRFSEAIEIAQRAGEPLVEGEALLRSAIVYGQVSRIPEGIARLDRAIPLFRLLGFRGAEGRAIDRRGELMRRVGDLVAAEQDLKAALPLVTEARAYEGILDVRNNLGLLCEQSGRWDDAIALFEAALPLADRASLDTESSLLANLGNTYSDMGDYRRALTALERSLAMKRTINNPRRISQTLHAIALVRFATGDDAKGAVALQEALSLAIVSGDPTAIGTETATLGRLQLRHHHVDAAIESFGNALQMLHKVRDPRAEARVLTTLAGVQLDRNLADQALKTISLALAGARDAVDRVNESAALYLRARILQKTGHLDDALKDAQAAVDVVESMREAIVNPDLRKTYLGTVRRYFDLVIDLLMLEHEGEPQGGFAAEAFKANERSRARTLLESLARSQADVVKGIPPELLQQERNMRRNLEAKESYRAQLMRGDRRRTEIATAESAIRNLVADYRAVKARIRTVSPEYAALEFPEPLPLAEIQSRLLDSDTILIEYHLGVARSFVWVVSERNVTVHILPGETRVEELVRSWHDLLRQNPSAFDAAAAQKLRDRTEKAGQTLAQVIFRPVAAEVRGKRLLIVADGALHYAPFAALPDEQHKPLIASHEITSLPSATLLDTLRRMPRPTGTLGSVAVFADPVFQRNDSRFGKSAAAEAPVAESRSEQRWGTPADFRRLRFSRKEAEAILASADRSSSLEALDFHASKQSLMTADLRRYGILHIATHGVVNAEQPDLSGLVFSMYDRRGRKIDGYLRLHDVYNLDLNADLVVLSACRTALGKVVYGEGLIGLTRGFMYGGAKRVISTAWSVDDRAAAKLMANVYASMLRHGAPPARALREAQNAMLHDPRWRDPYYWAAFTLQGDWR